MSKELTPEQVTARGLYQKQWREANKEKLAEWYREYRKKNPDVNKRNTKLYRKRHPERAKISTKKYKSNNQDKIKEYSKKYKPRKNQLQIIKRKTDPLFRLKSTMRIAILKAFDRINTKKNNKTVQILGCNYKELKYYIESLWEPWMSWENHGLYNGTAEYGWDIDHIIPLKTAITVEDVIRLSHYTNLQPLCSYINRDVKKDNITY